LQYERLGGDGPQVSEVGIGTWQASGEQWGSDVRFEKIKEAIRRANELGVNLIDTAEAYGNGQSEKVVGEAVAELDRGKVMVATKVNSHLRHDDVKRACEESLERLGLDKIDLYQVHWPDPWSQIPLRETMTAMEELYQEGKIGAIGVSNFAVRDLEEARAILDEGRIVSNQVIYNMLERQIEEEVLPYCREHDITVIGYSPLAQGLLTGKYGPDNKPDDDVRSGSALFKDHNLREIGGLLDVMEEVAENHGKAMAQVALNWIVDKPGVIAIPGAKNSDQAQSNAAAVGWEMSSGEREKIDAELEELELDFF